MLSIDTSLCSFMFSKIRTALLICMQPSDNLSDNAIEEAERNSEPDREYLVHNCVYSRRRRKSGFNGLTRLDFVAYLVRLPAAESVLCSPCYRLHHHVGNCAMVSLAEILCISAHLVWPGCRCLSCLRLNRNLLSAVATSR